MKRSSFLPKVLIIAVSAAFIGGAVSKWVQLRKTYQRKQDFEKKIEIARVKKEALLQDLKESEDPVWLELVLMEELGVIPDGAIKINYLEE